MRICVFTLGCKVNQSESDSLIKDLKSLGHEVVDELSFCDLYIVNTCAVTGEAEKKSRQTYARILAINPNAKIIYTGCASQKDPESFAKKSDSVLVTGTFNKGEIISLLDKTGLSLFPESKAFEELSTPESLRTRTYVKIQDGCNNFCSYCIIPYLRGRSRSRNSDKIVEEIAKINSPEVVLGGIDISSYNDNGVTLTGLINKLRGTVSRIRIGSFEVGVINDELLTALKNLKDFAPHFHLSLQSGCDEVLKKMNRRYTTSEYLEKVNLIRKYFPNAGITTDIIVGFPTETEENAFATLEFVKEVAFSDIHPFPYSHRTGTVASKLIDINGDVKKARLNKLIELKKQLKNEFLEKNVGNVVRVLFETDENGYFAGYSENYIRVYAKGDNLADKTIKEVKIIKTLFDGVLGEII